MTNHTALLREVTDALRGVCDGAVVRDAQGFNKPDADIVRKCYPDMVAIAPLLLKYKVQIEAHGFDYMELKDAIVAVCGTRPTWNWNEHTVGFGMHAKQTYKFMAENQRGYLVWMVERSKIPHNDPRWIAANAVLSDMPIPDLTSEAKKEQADKSKIRLVSLEPGRVGIQAPFSEKDRCKALSERKWQTPFWSCPVAIIEEVVAAFPEGEQSEGFRRLVADVLERKSKRDDLTHGVELEHFGNAKQILPFQMGGVRFIDANKGVGIINDQPGCISGDALISLHRAGKSFKIRLDQLHLKFNHLGGNWKPETDIPTMARSLMLNETFRLNKVLNVIYKGEKETLLIKTDSGKELKLTPDHKVRTSVGWIEAWTLKAGSQTLVTGDIITSVAPAGIQRVFDIQMDHPAHNFIANGIVVHNCGKTVQALGLLALHPEWRPAIIVSPAVMKYKWEEEAHTWLETDDVIEVVKNGKLKTLTGDIIVINYDILKKWVPELKKINPSIIIYDEIHYCKHPKTARATASMELAETIPRRVGLTGTLADNRPSDLWGPLQIIDKVNYPDSRFFRWHVQFCDGHKIFAGLDRNRKPKMVWDFTGASNLDELRESLKPILIRRTKEEVMPELPEKRRQTIFMDISNRREYNKASKEFLSWIAEQNGTDAAKKAERAEELVKRSHLRRLAIEGKMKACMEWIDNFLLSGEKLIIFAVHKPVIHALMERYSDIAVKIDGSVTGKAKHTTEQRFQTDQNIKLFVGNIHAAGVGITLTAASDILFIELDQVPERHNQAESRAHRYTQTKGVNITYAIADNTIDAVIANMLNEKQIVLNQITGDKNTLSFDLFKIDRSE